MNFYRCYPFNGSFINLFLIGCKGRGTGAEWQKFRNQIEKKVREGDFG
jgi:hypothetical protein